MMKYTKHKSELKRQILNCFVNIKNFMFIGQRKNSREDEFVKD